MPGTLLPLLAAARHLQRQPLPDPAYYTGATQTRDQIGAVVEEPTQHLGVRRLQDLFQEHADCLDHGVTNRCVPPDNNRCERELRPAVIARKVRFGSPSDAGAPTREILMSVLHTLRKHRAWTKTTAPVSPQSSGSPTLAFYHLRLRDY